MHRPRWDRLFVIALGLMLLAVPLTLGVGSRALAQAATPTPITVDGDDCDDIPLTGPIATIAATAPRPSTDDDDDDDDDHWCVEIELDDIYFDPNVITLPADQDVVLLLHNDGQAVHNFSVTDHGNAGLTNLNIDVTLEPNQSQAIIVKAVAGDYYFFCNQPGHEAAGMRGYLKVAPNAEIDTEEATVTPRAG